MRINYVVDQRYSDTKIDHENDVIVLGSEVLNSDGTAGTIGEMVLTWVDGGITLTISNESFPMFAVINVFNAIARLGDAIKPPTVGEVIDELAASGFEVRGL